MIVTCGTDHHSDMIIETEKNIRTWKKESMKPTSDTSTRAINIIEMKGTTGTPDQEAILEVTADAPEVEVIQETDLEVTREATVKAPLQAEDQKDTADTEGHNIIWQ